MSRPQLLMTDLQAIDPYTHDATTDKGIPDAVIMAETEQDVIATIKFCHENRLSVIPRGAGTGLSGGCIAEHGGIVLSTERMKELTIDSKQQFAVCGPGLITKELIDAAAVYGLTYPPDPASFAESTLGGNVAEGAGGLRCKRFGVTEDYVIGLEAITSTGKKIQTGFFTQQQGFAIEDILIASEGTLAVITKIAFRLIPTPKPGTTLLVAFDNPTNAAKTIEAINRSGMILTVMEYLDGDAAACSNAYEKTDGLDNVAALLLLETTGETAEADTKRLQEICRHFSASYFRIETDPQTAQMLWKVRRNLSKAVKSMAKIRISEDVAIPNSKFAELVAFVDKRNRLGRLKMNAFGHAGDGNLHVNFMGVTGTAEELQVIEEEIELMLKKTIELGGTLTGEHGVGIAKRKYLPLEFDQPTLLAMKQLKETFDAGDLLNPGKIFFSA